MNRWIRKTINVLSIILIVLVSKQVTADGPPLPPGDPTGFGGGPQGDPLGGGAPVGGGTALLVIMAGGYALAKTNRQINRNTFQNITGKKHSNTSA